MRNDSLLMKINPISYGIEWLMALFKIVDLTKSDPAGVCRITEIEQSREALLAWPDLVMPGSLRAIESEGIMHVGPKVPHNQGRPGRVRFQSHLGSVWAYSEV